MKTFSNKVLTKPEAERALDTAVALVRRNLPLYTDHCQNHSSVHDIYPQCENNQWTCGFWPGEVWLSYERTGDEAFKNTALTLVDSVLYRIEHKIEVDHHDMGFLYSPSCVAAYKLTGSEKGRKAAILAADQLCTRFQEKGEFFQAWGVYGTAISYRYTRRPEYLDAFRRVLAYYLERLPEDLVPYWDMTFTSGTEEPRDSSSASIVACGLLEAAKYAHPDQAAEYTLLAAQMLGSVAEHYAVRQGPQGIGLVRHGTYSKKSPYNTCTPEGVDECVSWGDYFYMEALTRLTKDWELYW